MTGKPCTKVCMNAEIGGRDPLWEAREEIERLTVALQAIVALGDKYEYSEKLAMEMQNEASAALKARETGK